MRNRHNQAPHKRLHGTHVIQTEAQTLDEALDIIRHKQRHERPKGTKRTLKQQFNSAKFIANFAKPVSLSDRIVPKRNGQAAKVERPPDWTREQIIAAYKTGSWRPPDFRKHSKAPMLQIYWWCFGPEFKPNNFKCLGCGGETFSRRAVIAGIDPQCKHCGRLWNEGLVP